MNSSNRTLYPVLGFLALIVGFFSWIDLLWPPADALVRYKGDLLRVVIELLAFRSPIYANQPLKGYLFIMLTPVALVAISAAVRALLAYVDNSRVAVSILQTDMHLTFEDASMVQARLRRDQLFHANRFVTANKWSSEVTRDGASQTKDDLFVESCIGKDRITKEIIPNGSSRKKEVIEVFERPLPTRFYVTYLPNSIVLGLYQWLGLFKSVIVKRRAWDKTINEYNGKEGGFSLTSLVYPVTNVRIRIDFPYNSAPDIGNVTAYIYRDNVVEPIHITPDARSDVMRYEISLRSFYKSTLRIRWINQPSVVAP